MKTPKILVLFYSLTGATAKLAQEIATGAEGVESAQVSVKRVPELLPNSFFLENPHLKETKERLEKEFPLATTEDLVNADGLALGTPVHFGSFASQIKNFIDSLSPVWLQGKLVNKPAAVFCSAGSLHGGEEVALTSLMMPLLSLGMVPVGIPYPIQGEGPDFDAGSPYGAIFVTGHRGENELSEGDKKVAQLLGRRLAIMAHTLNCECEDCSRLRGELVAKHV